jgi:hypothetical protein
MFSCFPFFLQIYEYFFFSQQVFIKIMDYNEIIQILKLYTQTNNEELGEQDAAATTTSSTGGQAYPTVTKWETGLTRSHANTIDDKVTWRSLYKITRGKANTLL